MQARGTTKWSSILVASWLIASLASAIGYQRAELGDGFEQDFLSQRDRAIYKYRGPNYWRARSQETLKQVLLVHRHGDRTPIHPGVEEARDHEQFFNFHGLGQLTNRGKARLYMLGKIMRHRYDTFLNGSVSKQIRNSRASGSLRCIESAQVFMASFLALDHDESPDADWLQWDEPDNRLAQVWQPAAILTTAARWDGLLNEDAQCNSLLDEHEKLGELSENQQLLREFEHELQLARGQFKPSVGQRSLQIAYYHYAGRISSRYTGKVLGSQSQAISPKKRRLRAGLLINDIIENMRLIRHASKGPFAKKFLEYSGHDITVVLLLALLDNLDQFQRSPDYCANIAFELHEDQGEWFIKIFYMRHVPSKPVELHMGACEAGHARRRCTLDKFEQLMQKYRITSWLEWMLECHNPLESVDPYEQNL